MKKLFLVFALMASVAWAVTPVSKVPTASDAVKWNKWMGPVAQQTDLGTKLQYAHNTAVGVWDYSYSSSEGGWQKSHEVGITLPSKAIVKKVWFDVITQPVGSGAEIGFTIQSAYDAKALTGVSSWTTGNIDGALDGAVANFVKLTAARKVYCVVSTASVTAGKIKVFVDYVLSE